MLSGQFTLTFQVIKVKYCVERNRLGIKTGGKAHADYSDFLFFLRHRYIDIYIYIILDETFPTLKTQ